MSFKNAIYKTLGATNPQSRQSPVPQSISNPHHLPSDAGFIYSKSSGYSAVTDGLALIGVASIATNGASVDSLAAFGLASVDLHSLTGDQQQEFIRTALRLVPPPGVKLTELVNAQINKLVSDIQHAVLNGSFSMQSFITPAKKASDAMNAAIINFNKSRGV